MLKHAKIELFLFLKIHNTSKVLKYYLETQIE